MRVSYGLRGKLNLPRQPLSSMEPLVVSGSAVTPRLSVVLLHGLGDTGQGLRPLADLFVSQMPYLCFVLPTAPTRPVTINAGLPMPAWYDIEQLAHRSPESLTGWDQSRAYVAQLCAAIDTPLIVGGFSQGGALAVSLGLSSPLLSPLPQAVFALSTYMVTPAAKEAANIPLFWAHGSHDEVIPLSWGRSSFDKLKETGHLKDAVFKSYRMGHEICMDEITDLAAFLERFVPAT